MSSRSTYDNWERLVAATVKREQIRQLCHAPSREPSISSRSSDFSCPSPLPSVPSDSWYQRNSFPGSGSEVEHIVEVETSQVLAPERIFVNGSRTSTLPLSPSQNVHFGVSSEELVSISREHDISLLQQNGGVKGLAEKLKCNLEKGVPGDDVDLINRKIAFGLNTYPQRKGRGFWRFVRNVCRRTTPVILTGLATASLAAVFFAVATSLPLGAKTMVISKGWNCGISIAFCVLLAIIFSGVIEYRQPLNMEKQNRQVEVIRSGWRIKVSIFEIVVGDVVPLKIGDQVPADGLVISSRCLSIDESSTPGESRIVHKDSIRAPFLIPGCKIAGGCGTMLVMSVGLNTERGLLVPSISENNGEGIFLQINPKQYAAIIGVASLAGLLLGVVLETVHVTGSFTGHTKDPDLVVTKTFPKAVHILVAAVLESCVIPVAGMLAIPVTEMYLGTALARRLSAWETLGYATTICSDKTGTLTLNQMTVVEAYACGKKIDTPDNKSLLPPSVISLLIEGIAQNTTGSVFVPEDGGAMEVSGSPTEKAILQWGVNLGMDFHAVRSNSVAIHASPFNSEEKRSSVALKLSNSEVRGHWKGAAEIVLASCTGYIDVNDHVVPMDEDKLSTFKTAIEDMASRTLRCIAIAYRPYEIDNIPSNDEESENWQLSETDLILLAVVGIKDPCRPGVRDAVKLCTDAGIKVRMVTGEHLQTARAIALECGILSSDGDATYPNIIDGRTFRNLTETQRLEVADRISVMGRSSLNDKLLLAQALGKRGHKVVVTGDGITDAPALQEADMDMGRSMVIQDRKFWRESPHIILNGNFASIIKAVQWGSCFNANMSKFQQYEITMALVLLIIYIVAEISSNNVPLNANQFPLVTLIISLLGAVALATEFRTDHLMHRPAVGNRSHLRTNIMRNSLIQALYQVIVLLFLYFRGRRILNLEHDTSNDALQVTNTLTFTAFFFCQVFNQFNTRNLVEINVWKGITKSHRFMGIVGLEVVLQVIIIFSLGKFTSTARLSRKCWLVVVAIGFMSCPVDAVGKLIPVPGSPFCESLIRRFGQRNHDGGNHSMHDVV